MIHIKDEVITVCKGHAKNRTQTVMIKIKLITTAVTMLLFVSATGASAQAFGIEKGTPIENLIVVREISEFQFSVTVPKPHSEFEAYTVFAAPEVGVCKVTGVGKDHDNDRYGSSVKSAFTDLKDALSGIYGANQSFDFIQNGALWDGPNEWVMSLRQNERYYSTFWTEEEKSDLPEGLGSIKLSVNALSSDSAYITLGYDFDNISECIRIKDSQDEGGL